MNREQFRELIQVYESLLFDNAASDLDPELKERMLKSLAEMRAAASE